MVDIDDYEGAARLNETDLEEAHNDLLSFLLQKRRLVLVFRKRELSTHWIFLDGDDANSANMAFRMGIPQKF